MSQSSAGAEAPDESGHAESPTGWTALEHIALPLPTYWPAVLALAITLLAWSLITSWFIFGVGLLLFVVGLAGWIGDLLHGD